MFFFGLHCLTSPIIGESVFFYIFLEITFQSCFLKEKKMHIFHLYIYFYPTVWNPKRSTYSPAPALRAASWELPSIYQLASWHKKPNFWPVDMNLSLVTFVCMSSEAREFEHSVPTIYVHSILWTTKIEQF